MASVRRHNLGWLLLSALVVAADQCSKAWITRTIALYGRRPLIAHFNLIHTQNTGVAFSMLNRMPPMSFIVLSGAVAAGIAAWLWRHPNGERLVAASLALILGGAIGNAIDRFRFGYVVDFIDFYVGNWHFATFNIADSAISVGAGLLILDMLIEQRRSVRTPH